MSRKGRIAVFGRPFLYGLLREGAMEDIPHKEITDLALGEVGRKEVDAGASSGMILVSMAIELMAQRHVPMLDEKNCGFLNRKLEDISAKLMYLHEHYELRPK